MKQWPNCRNQPDVNLGMKSPIGESLRGRPLAISSCALLAVVAVIWDFILSHDYASYAMRVPGVGVAFLVVAVLARGNLQSLGICRPLQGFRYWAKWSCIAVVWISIVIVIGVGVWWLLGNKIPIYGTKPGDLGRVLVHSCIAAPFVEELLYRCVLGVAATAILRPVGTIVLSGIVFAGLHFIYGTPSPENQVGGFLLAWAYFRSGSLVVPLAWHAVGNLLAVACQVIAFYWFGASGVIE
jgi:membrane protease YdiL (CAAX protease family)